MSLVGEVGFSAAFAFKYSPRPGTPAERLGDDIPEEEKDERLAMLFAEIARHQSAHLTSLVGTTAEVLVEGRSRSDERRYSGRSERHEIVHVEPPPGIDPTGAPVEVEVVEAFAHSLLGRMVGARRAPRPLPVVGDHVS
jgi:tRNA-2-methylthio-N6-dimethylallyladenosine synthase